jgi:hypothetical protein
MGDLHQRLSELKRCFDDQLISANEYESARSQIMNFWLSELRRKLYFITKNKILLNHL